MFSVIDRITRKVLATDLTHTEAECMQDALKIMGDIIVVRGRLREGSILG